MEWLPWAETGTYRTAVWRSCCHRQRPGVRYAPTSEAEEDGAGKAASAGDSRREPLVYR